MKQGKAVVTAGLRFWPMSWALVTGAVSSSAQMGPVTPRVQCPHHCHQGRLQPTLEVGDQGNDRAPRRDKRRSLPWEIGVVQQDEEGEQIQAQPTYCGRI